MANTADAPATDLPEPGRPTLWAALVFAIATMLLAYPALAGQILFNVHSDQYLLGFAFRDFAAQSLRAGTGVPQWNPYVQGGLPYIGAMHGDIFYPTFLLRMIMPTAVAMTWEFPIHLFLAGLFTFLFLRAWRLGFYASLIGALAYMLSGSIAGYASPGHDGKLFVSALFPAALHLLTLGVRDGRRWAWGLFAIVIGLATLSPHPQLLQYLLLASGCFTLYLAFATHDDVGKLPTNTGIARIGLALAGVIVGLMIGAVQFASALAYKSWSPRAAGHDWLTATSYSFPIEETFNAYLPQFSGILEKYWGQNLIHFHSDYFGVVVLLLVGAAFGATGNRSFKRFWIATGIAALLWAWGGNTPLYHLILLIPYTKYTRAPSTIIFITAFAAAVLAAIGAERALSRRVPAKYAMGWMIAGGLIAVIVTVGYRSLVGVAMSMIGAHFEQFGPGARDQYVPVLTDRSEGNVTAAIVGAWRSFVFVGLTAAAIWAFVTNKLSVRLLAAGLVALVIVDLWSIEHLYWRFMPPASVTFASDQAADAIKTDIAQSGPGRTIIFNVNLPSGIDGNDPVFRSRALMGLGIRTVQGNQGNELGIYRTMMEEADSGMAEFRPAFWRHENVRYIYTGYDEPTMARIGAQLGWPALVKLGGPARNAAGSMVYSYRIPLDNPAAWVAGGAVSAPPEAVLPTVLNPRYDPLRAALIDTGATIAPRSVAAVAATPVTARVSKYEPGKIAIDLSAPAPEGSVLVMSENYYPGWKATAGETTLPISRVNYNLIGVGLAAGTRHVDLSFTDQSYGRGKALTFVALLIAIGALVAGLVLDRRPAPATTAA